MAEIDDLERQQTTRGVSPWIIAMTVSIATFMEVMDTSIANVALRHIAGNLAAGPDESIWVLTSYLVSNAIILPISGWLASVMGRKRFYMTCVALFTFSSFLCGIAPSLGWLLFFRVLQGIGGGGLAPSEQSILTDTFPARLRGQAFALYGLAVVVAPAIGPALGGWITDNYEWRWIFFINIPIGILSLFLTYHLVFDSPSAQREHDAVWKGGKLKIDYVGFGLIALGLGSLQVVLDKGQEDDWFGSNFIVTFMCLAAFGIIGGVIWELFLTDHPIVDLPMFKDTSFLVTNIVMFSVFFVLLSTTQLLPQYVQDLMGYDATKAGLILMPGGFTIMALMPVVGRLVNTVQPKYLIAFGLLMMSAAMEYMTNFDPSMSFYALSVVRMFQAGALAFLFVPINTIAYTGLPEGKSNNASALINLMRNLGGSVGVSVATTMIERRSQLHQERIGSHISVYNPLYNQMVHRLSQQFIAGGSAPGLAMAHARGLIYGMLAQQAAAVSYLDVFKVMSVGALVILTLVVFLKRVQPGGAVAAH